MEYRRLGTTGLQVSRLGLGCGNFGGVGSAPAFYGRGESEPEAKALMGPRRCRPHGQGAVRRGASNIEAWRLARALWISDVDRLHRFEWVQNSYSLLDRAPEREGFPLWADQGLGFTAFSPLAGGWLSGKYRAGTAYPAGSRMTLRPEGYQHLVSPAIWRSLPALRRFGTRREPEASRWARSPWPGRFITPR